MKSSTPPHDPAGFRSSTGHTVRHEQWPRGTVGGIVGNGGNITKAMLVIEDAVQEFKPDWIFALFSGGHDSLTASYAASLHGFDGCVHINTGIGIPETRQFVIDTCREHKWPLLEYKATENTKADGTPQPMDYDQIVMQKGFPGPYGHTTMYRLLKKYQITRLRRDHPGKVLLVSGQRKQESKRRSKNVTGPLTIETKNLAWCRPIFDWSRSDCSEILTISGFKRNQVVLRLGRSGECLCGAFAKHGELAAIEFACPSTARKIRELEIKVRAAGFPWGWEDSGPPKWWLEKNAGQTFMFNYDIDDTPQRTEEHLCTSCHWRAR